MLAITSFLLRPNHGEMLRVTAEPYHLILLAYIQKKRTWPSVSYLHPRLCGLASSKIHGNGWMGVTHHFVSGNPINHSTLEIKSVSLQFLKMRGSGITGTAKGNLVLFVMGVSWFSLLFVFYVSKVIM